MICPRHASRRMGPHQSALCADATAVPSTLPAPVSEQHDAISYYAFEGLPTGRAGQAQGP